MTSHAQLVEVARKWLKVTCRCPVVITEMVSNSTEIPDAIGWIGAGYSILVECKTSRSDFFADAQKPFRTLPDRGMGDYRYFLTMPELLRVEELPKGWGLLEATARGVNVRERSHGVTCWCKPSGDAGADFLRRPATRVFGPTSCLSPFEKKANDAEAILLMSLIRRLAGPGVRGKATVDIAAYVNDEHGNPVTASVLLGTKETAP